MSGWQFTLIVFLIGTPLVFMTACAAAKPRHGLDVVLAATVVVMLGVLMVAWGMRLAWLAQH